MSLKNTSKTTTKHPAVSRLEEMRKSAKHGDFYFASYSAIGQKEREAPVFILGHKDYEDLIICSCTKNPPRTDYDISVNLKLKTSVRTNKIYTIKREQLAFKIPQAPTPEEYKQIMEKVNESIQP